MVKTSVVIPNWNGKDRLGSCLNALKNQSAAVDIIVVDNGSVDGSAEYIAKKYPGVKLLQNPKNLGFAGGVNTGIRYALASGYHLIALLNNDAVVDKDWIRQLISFMSENKKAGIVTSKMYSEGDYLDDTGDLYTIWGLPFPRGRDEKDEGQYDNERWVMAASGGASLYRAELFRQIGLFDEDFFAYYEDVDLSFRAQLAGWKVGYEPKAIVHHQIGATSKTIPGFATYQTLKNLPMLYIKNVPASLHFKIFPRFLVLYFSIYLSAVARGQFWPASKGLLVSIVLWPKKIGQRFSIQLHRKVKPAYIASIMVHDLPPNARKLRAMRKIFSLGLIK